MDKCIGMFGTCGKSTWRNHGDSTEFEAAVWAAYCDLFVNAAEAHAAIRKYKLEWDTAGHKHENYTVPTGR